MRASILPVMGQEGDSSVVVTGLAISFALVDVDYCCVPEFLWQLLLVPRVLVQASLLVIEAFTTGLVHLSRNGIGARRFSTGHLLDRFCWEA